MKDFFADPQFKEELRRSAAETREKIADIGTVSEIGSGDCFFIPESDDLPVRWVAVLQHKDNPSLWFLVAADEFSQVGTCDVEIPEANPVAPLVMRCNVGVWAHKDDIDLTRYIGRLDSESVAGARSRLSEMVRGEVPITEHGIVAEGNDEYRDWMAELSDIAGQIESRMHSEPVVLHNPVFDSSWTDLAIVVEHRPDYVTDLAADAAGLQKPTADAPPALAIESSLPGQLLLQRDGDGFDLVYFPTSEEDRPPKLTNAVGLQVKHGHWEIGADGVYTWSQPLPMSGGHISFTVGGKAFDIALP